MKQKCVYHFPLLICTYYPQFNDTKLSDNLQSYPLNTLVQPNWKVSDCNSKVGTSYLLKIEIKEIVPDTSCWRWPPAAGPRTQWPQRAAALSTSKLDPPDHTPTIATSWDEGAEEARWGYREGGGGCEWGHEGWRHKRGGWMGQERQWGHEMVSNKSRRDGEAWARVAGEVVEE